MRRTPALLAALSLGGAIAATSATQASAFDPVPAPDAGEPGTSVPAPMSYSALRAVFRVLAPPAPAPPLVGDSYPSESPKVMVGGPALTEAVLDLGPIEQVLKASEASRPYLLMVPQTVWAEWAGGSYGTPTPRPRQLADAMLDAPSTAATDQARGFVYRADDMVSLIYPQPTYLVRAGGTAPGSPSLDAALDVAADD